MFNVAYQLAIVVIWTFPNDPIVSINKNIIVTVGHYDKDNVLPRFPSWL